MAARDADDHLRGVRSCDDVLACLASYPQRDKAIRRLERAISIDRLAAALAAYSDAGSPR